MINLQRWFTSIARKFNCAQDNGEIIIAAENTVLFKQVLDVMYIAYTTGFDKISFATIGNSFPYKGNYSDFDGYYYIPYENALPGFFLSDKGINDRNYFQKVMAHYRLLGKELTLSEVTEYTASVKITTFPPIAALYDDSSFVGLSNLSTLYFKPGRYVLQIYKGKQSTSLDITLNQGKNELAIVRLPNTTLAPLRNKVKISKRWFDESPNHLNQYAEVVIAAVAAHVKAYKNAVVELMHVQCNQNLRERMWGDISDKHISILEKELTEHDIPSEKIKKSSIEVTKGIGTEAIYLLIKDISNGTAN
jgi:hypothetical protein